MPLIVADIVSGFAKETTAGFKKSAADRQNIINIAASRAITEGGRLYDIRKLELKRVREALKWAEENGFDTKNAKFLASRSQEEFEGIKQDLREAQLRHQASSKKSAEEAEIELRRRISVHPSRRQFEIGEPVEIGEPEFDPYKVFGMEAPSLDAGIKTRQAFDEEWYKTTAAGIVGNISPDDMDRDQEMSIAAQLRNAFSKQFGLPGGERKEALDTAGRVLGLTGDQIADLMADRKEYETIKTPEGFRRYLSREMAIKIEEQEIALKTARDTYEQAALKLKESEDEHEFINMTVGEWKRENTDADTSWLIDHKSKEYPDAMKLGDVLRIQNFTAKNATIVELLSRNNKPVTFTQLNTQGRNVRRTLVPHFALEGTFMGEFWASQNPASELELAANNTESSMVSLWSDILSSTNLDFNDARVLQNESMGDFAVINFYEYLHDSKKEGLTDSAFIKELKEGERNNAVMDTDAVNKMTNITPAMLRDLQRALKRYDVDLKDVTATQIHNYWLSQAVLSSGERKSFFDVAKKQTRTTEVGAAGDTPDDVEVETAEQKAARLAAENRLAEIREKQDQAGADPILETAAAGVLRDGLNNILGNLGDDEWQRIVGSGDQTQIANTLYPLLQDIQKQLNEAPYNLEISTGQIFDPILSSIKEGNTDITRDDIIIKILGSRRAETVESRPKKEMGERLGVVVAGYDNLVGGFIQEHLIKINDLDDSVTGTPEQQKNASELIALERDVDNAIASYQNETMSEQTVIAIIKEAGLFTSKLIQQDIDLRKANEAPTYYNSHRFTSHVQSFNELFSNE